MAHSDKNAYIGVPSDDCRGNLRREVTRSRWRSTPFCIDDVVLRLAYRKTSTTPPVRQRCSDELAGLVGGVVTGDRSAVHSLMVALAPHLLRTVRGVLGRHDPDVEDVAQDAALTVLQVLPSYRGQGTVCRFACSTAVLVAMNARRRKLSAKRGGPLPSRGDIDVDEVAAPSSWMLPGHCGPEESLCQNEAASAARDLVLTLPPAQAEVLALHCMAGCTVPEIAEATGVPRETVRSRLRLARQALRRRLESEPTWLELLEGER